MKTYYPAVGDQIVSKDGKTITVTRVFPNQIIFDSPNGANLELEPSVFTRKAQVSMADGAKLIRNGEEVDMSEPVITPEPEETPRSGSHNTHARLSPSDSKRWTSCTASIAFQEANAHRVIDGGSREATEGTEAHDWASNVLLGKTAPMELPESFRDPVLAYTDHCNSLAPEGVVTNLQECLDEAELGFDPPTHAMFVEEEIPLFYQPEETGTADFIAVTPDRVYVRDLKYGMGVLVSSQKNTQLAIYAYSVIVRLNPAYNFSDDMLVDIGIVQPRHREAQNASWQITIADLRTFCEDIEYRAIQARTAAERVRERITTTGQDVSCAQIKEAAPGSQFAPSEGDEGACRWCRCKAFCEARLSAMTESLELPSMSAEEMLESMPDMSKTEQKLPVEERIALVGESLGSQGMILTDEYLVRLFGRAKALRSFLSDVEEYLEARLLTGEEIEGVKLVDGREGNRVWSNADEAEVFLKNQGLKQDERCDIKLKSPAAIEKLIKDNLKNTRTKNRFEQLIVRSAAQKKLAIDDDPREARQSAVALMPSADDDFEV